MVRYRFELFLNWATRLWSKAAPRKLIETGIDGLEQLVNEMAAMTSIRETSVNLANFGMIVFISRSLHAFVLRNRAERIPFME